MINKLGVCLFTSRMQGEICITKLFRQLEFCCKLYIYLYCIRRHDTFEMK